MSGEPVRRQAKPSQPGVAPKLADIEIGKIFLAPELSDIWRRNSRTNPAPSLRYRGSSHSTPTVTSLARESGINRTSLYQRHPDLIAEFKANAPNAAVTPAAQALRGQLDSARTRIADLEQQNAALGERVRALTALVAEMSLEADGKTNVIPLKR